MAVERGIKRDLGESDRMGMESRDRNETVDQRILDDDLRLEAFKDLFFQSALPTLPKIPGYHTCWLTTTNQKDTIHMRMRMGYIPVKPEEIPGWEHYSIKTGDYAGMIGINEMLAFKIPLSLYEKVMTEFHHRQPLQAEAAIINGAEDMKNQMRASRSYVTEDEGFTDLRNRQRIKPSFELG